MAEIDSLEIKIQAQATKANNAIDKLITKLDKLSTSLNSINTSNLNGLANSLNRLSSAMQSMNNVKTTDFTRLAKGIEKMSTVDTAKINRAASSMNQLSRAFRNIQASSSATAQISELARGISQLGYKSSTKAIENIPKLATAMTQLMTTLSKAPTVSRNLIDMTNALAKLARTGASSGRAANSLASSLNIFSRSATYATKKSFSLASAFGKMYATYWLLFRAFRKLKEAIDLSSSLTEVQNVVDTTFGKMTSKVDDFAKNSIEQFGMSELAVKQYSSNFQAMGQAMGISSDLVGKANRFLNEQTKGYVELSNSMADVSLNLTKLTADIASFYDKSQADVAEDLRAIFTGQVVPLRKYGIDLTQATLKEWALKNGLDADIKSMTQAQKTMLRYQYVMANTIAAQGDFAKTSDTWANQLRILSENFKSLGTIIGGWLINAFKPFVRNLNQVMQYVIAFAETVTNALGSIFGWQYEVSAGGVAEDWADGMEDFSDATGDAAKNAKKLKNNLLGIDELNIISEDKDSKSSGGSAGASKVDKTQGGLVQVDTIFKGYESSIKTLEQLGNKVRDTLIGAMDSIEWDSVFEKARNFGTGLADFLNGLLDYDGEGRTLFGKVAQTLANTLNAIVYAAQSFAETFDFYQFGVNIADAINNFFATFDFKAFADTLNKWVDGLENTIKGFLDKADWKTVLKGFYDFFSNLELDTISIIVGTVLIKKILRANIIGSALTSVGNKIATGIATSVGTAITKAGGLSGLLTLDMAALVGETGWATAGLLAGGAIIGGIVAAFSGWNFGQFLYEKISGEEINMTFKDQMSEILSSFTDGSGKQAIALWGEDIKNGLSAVGETVNQWMKDTFGNWAGTTFADALKDIKSFFSDMGTSIDESFTEMSDKIVTFWDKSISPWFTEDKWSELLTNVTTAFQTKWNEIVEWWNGTALVTWWDESVVPWFSLEKWLEVLNNVKESFSIKWEETSTQWTENLNKWWTVNVAPWFTKKKWGDILAKVPTAFKDAFKAAANGAIGFLNGVISGVESLVNHAIDGLKKLAEAASKIPGISFSIDIPNVSLPRIPKFSTGGFPEDGLFMANHNELVGQFSNGKTAVANNEQIVEGISQGVRQAVTDLLEPYLAELVNSNREIADKDSTINIDGRELVSATDERRNRNGFSFA